jgi:hypothetical protein
MTWLGVVALMMASCLLGFIFGVWLTVAREDDE